MTGRLPKLWNLPPEVTSAFGGRVQEQRALFQSEHLVIVAHHAAGVGADGPPVYWRSPDGVWKCTEGGNAIASLTTLVCRYEGVAHDLDQRLAAASVARDFFEVLTATRPLAHRARDLTKTLERASRLVPADVDLERIFMRARGVARHLELLVLRAEDGRNFDLAQLNEEQADISNQMVVSSQRLNFLIAMLLPMTALASIFGMNLATGVEAGSPSLFWLVVALSIVMGAVLSFFIGRMPRQLRRESHLETWMQQVEVRGRALRDEGRSRVAALSAPKGEPVRHASPPS